MSLGPTSLAPTSFESARRIAGERMQATRRTYATDEAARVGVDSGYRDIGHPASSWLCR